MTKKIILTIFLFFINITFFTGNIFAAPSPFSPPETVKTWALGHYGSGNYIIVTVQEPIPGMNCYISESSWNSGGIGSCHASAGAENKEVKNVTDLICPASMTYDCYQEKGFGSLKTIIGTFIKFLTYLVGIIGVLYLVINGIMLSMSGFGSGMKENVKKGIIQAILGIIVLFLGGFILHQIAPWIFGV